MMNRKTAMLGALLLLLLTASGVQAAKKTTGKVKTERQEVWPDCLPARR